MDSAIANFCALNFHEDYCCEESVDHKNTNLQCVGIVAITVAQITVKDISTQEIGVSITKLSPIPSNDWVIPNHIVAFQGFLFHIKMFFPQVCKTNGWAQYNNSAKTPFFWLHIYRTTSCSTFTTTFHIYYHLWCFEVGRWNCLLQASTVQCPY